MTIALRLLGGASFRGTDIGSARVRALLAALVEDSSGVSAASLAEQIWDDGRPAKPAKALQVLVSRARSQLGPDVIASTATGYRLALPPDEVDVHLARRRPLNGSKRLRLAEPPRRSMLRTTAFSCGATKTGSPWTPFTLSKRP